MQSTDRIETTVFLFKQMRKLFFCFSLSFLFLFAGCATLRDQVLSAEEEALLYPVSSYVPEFFDWQEVTAWEGTGEGAGAEVDVLPGIWRFDFENPDIPLIYHAVKVDLSFVGADAAGAESEHTLQLLFGRGLSTAKFAARTKCVVAVNATPFTRSGQLVGVHKEGGELLSQPVARYGAIAFREAKAATGEDGSFAERGESGLEARIFASQADGELEDWPYALGGFFTVLEDGAVLQDFIRRGDSRSGVGLSADGKTLFILVVEGERPLQSRGLSYPQCGEIFREMGCSDALEFDGGSSAELCINGLSLLSYKNNRVQANSLGFCQHAPAGE